MAVAADGAVWVGTPGGAARLGPGGIRRYTMASGVLPHDWVTSILPDGDHVVVGTYDAGLARLDVDGSGGPLTDIGPLWINPNGLARVGDAMVAATLGDGLVVAARGRVRIHTDLPSTDVTAVIAHDGGLFVGTRGGLVRWDPAPAS